MAKSDMFLTQHTELVGIVQAIAAKLTPDQVKSGAAAIHADLSKLAGKITVHLGMEDKVVYPSLQKNAQFAAVGDRFSKEMGGIAAVFGTYMKKWSTPAALAADANGFVTETKNLFAALGKRIEAENKELYPAFDKC